MQRVSTFILCSALAAGGVLASARASASDADPDAHAGEHPLLALGATYTGERWSAVDGGVATGGAYVDNLDLTAEMDGRRAFGVDGLKLFAYVLYNNGHEFAGPYAGAAQGISNIEAVRAWRLYEAWADWAIGNGSLRFGLYDLNSEFDATDTGAVFIHPAHGIGTEIAQAGANGPSIFPITSLGVRYRHEAGSWAWQFAALDGVPGDPEDPTSNRVRFGGGDGALLVGEVGRTFDGARAVLGAWHFTADFDDVRDVDANGDPVQRSGASGVYGFVEGRLYAEDDAEQGLSAFLRADSRTSACTSSARTSAAVSSTRARCRAGPATASGSRSRAPRTAIGSARRRRSPARPSSAARRSGSSRTASSSARRSRCSRTCSTS